MLTLREQLTGLVVMTVVGVIGGVFFDLYRALRLQLQLRKKGTFFGDLFYCLCFTAFFLRVLLPVNDGQLRSYVYLGMLLGFTLYFAKLHRFWWIPAVWLVKWGCRVLGRCWRVVSWPFRRMGGFICRPLGKLKRHYQERSARRIKKNALNQQKYGKFHDLD